MCLSQPRGGGTVGMCKTLDKEVPNFKRMPSSHPPLQKIIRLIRAPTRTTSSGCLRDVEQTIRSWQAPCPLRASWNMLALWSAAGWLIQSHLCQLRVAANLNAEFLGHVFLISSILRVIYNGGEVYLYDSLADGSLSDMHHPTNMWIVVIGLMTWQGKHMIDTIFFSCLVVMFNRVFQVSAAGKLWFICWPYWCRILLWHNQLELTWDDDKLRMKWSRIWCRKQLKVFEIIIAFSFCS